MCAYVFVYVCMCDVYVCVCVWMYVFLFSSQKEYTSVFLYSTSSLLSLTLSYSLSSLGISFLDQMFPSLSVQFIQSFPLFFLSFLPSSFLLQLIHQQRAKRKTMCFRHNHSSLSLLWRGLGQRDKGTKGDQGEGRKEGRKGKVHFFGPFRTGTKGTASTTQLPTPGKQGKVSLLPLTPLLSV